MTGDRIQGEVFSGQKKWDAHRIRRRVPSPSRAALRYSAARPSCQRHDVRRLFPHQPSRRCCEPREEFTRARSVPSASRTGHERLVGCAPQIKIAQATPMAGRKPGRAWRRPRSKQAAGDCILAASDKPLAGQPTVTRAAAHRLVSVALCLHSFETREESARTASTHCRPRAHASPEE